MRTLRLSGSTIMAHSSTTNSEGRPYLKDPPGGNYGGNNPRAQADTLLHELAHLWVGQQFLVPTTVPRGTPPAPALLSIAFLHDSLFVNPAGQNNNRQLLTAKCGSLILTFPAQWGWNDRSNVASPVVRDLLGMRS